MLTYLYPGGKNKTERLCPITSMDFVDLRNLVQLFALIWTQLHSIYLLFCIFIGSNPPPPQKKTRTQVLERSTRVNWTGKVIFLRFKGVIRSIKVVSIFRFGHWKCHFWYPQNSQKGVILAILGEPKMAFPMPETKNGDQFYRPNYPPKHRKNHLRNVFLYIGSGFLAILLILHIFGPFLECKTKSALVPRKMASNQKMQEKILL